MAAQMAVAYYVPHSDGTESGIIDAPGFSSGLSLIDLYEVDATIRSFASREEAEAWLNGKLDGRELVTLVTVVNKVGVVRVGDRYLHREL